jgi:beta-glucosidase
MSGQFPDGFIWGTATAAHQVEGGNTNCDLWPLEMADDSIFAEPSGDACDHYHLYNSDIGLLKRLGFGAYRFSIEWARIQPEEKFFSAAALDHYRRVLGSCIEHGIVPIVTFHHFTSPLWFTRDGGWADVRSVDRFARYCERSAKALGDLIAHACTINEANLPMMVTRYTELARRQPFRMSKRVGDVAARLGADPERFAPFLLSDANRTTPNFIAAHKKAVAAIKGTGCKAPVGITLATQDLHAEPGGEALTRKLDYDINGQFFEAARGDDFLGVQTYSRTRIGEHGPLPVPPGAEVTQMGYEFYPEGLEATIRSAARQSGCPILVTENGIGTENDTRRIVYTERALRGVQRCLADGIDVRGYIHWSMLDNYEWREGYRPKFGLVAVGRTTQLRTPKPSAHWLGAIAKRNALANGA